MFYRQQSLTQLITGYEGPVTAAHIACLQLTAAQIMQLDLTGEQKVKLSPYQDAVVSSIIPSPYKACDETVMSPYSRTQQVSTHSEELLACLQILMFR